MKIGIFASDAKGLSILNSLINELHENNIDYFAMICQNTQLARVREDYSHLTNVETSEEIWSDTLLINIPFKPDWLVVQRERWKPETGIIQEFKNKFNSKIALVEQNAQMLNSVETILETYSRNRFVPYIDVFFDHSKWISEQRKLVGFKGNSFVVGNPKYDINLDVSDLHIKTMKEYYGVDDNKKQVLLFSLINTARENLFNEFEKYIEDNPDYQYFIKPYPGEPFGEQFGNEYFPNFRIKNVTPILDENHIWPMFSICDIHMGCLSSIFHASLLLKKEIIDFSKEIGMAEKYLDVDRIMKSTNKGVEDSKGLWMNSFGFTEDSQLLELLPKDLLKKIEENNNNVWNCQENVVSLFDDYNDGKASTRIIKYLKENV
tara:strand:+ start:1877 stop:3007 length:1131 start_codon:yes stop_codon:yes gene_type:complete